MNRPARNERHALCDLFLKVGPDAPTLCAGWTTRDLAAHLVVRETRPDAAGGILIRRLAPYGDRVRDKVARTDWTTLVDRVRNGPPRLSPMRIPALDDLTNTLEFFVHHE
ncbi:MAG: maleylpyruvate isomerase family mycothiol-dependent enzyme, partial [Acidimicrobiia bacterium]|nr:maleylpyruvate isomerase family mycothiol-dependent enzyme [Acidimicrobiia bacterium]